MAYVIKRYSNRKLYDTQESRHVTLEELQEMIRTGREVSVVAAQRGQDLTSVMLTQIILENERNHRANLPAAFLHQLIKHGDAWQDFFQRYMRASREGVVGNQRDMERIFREWAQRAGWGSGGSEAPPKRDGVEPEADKLRDEVSALRDRLRSLEERLQKRKADPK